MVRNNMGIQNDTSIADKVVTWVIYAIRTFGTLPADLAIVPFVSAEQAHQRKIVVKCETGPQILEADQCFTGDLSLEYKTVDRDAQDANDVWAKVENALVQGLQNTTSNAKALETFSRLDMLTEDAQNSTSNTANHRIFSRIIPLHIGLL